MASYEWGCQTVVETKLWRKENIYLHWTALCGWFIWWVSGAFWQFYQSSACHLVGARCHIQIHATNAYEESKSKPSVHGWTKMRWKWMEMGSRETEKEAVNRICVKFGQSTWSICCVWIFLLYTKWRALEMKRDTCLCECAVTHSHDRENASSLSASAHTHTNNTGNEYYCDQIPNTRAFQTI